MKLAAKAREFAAVAHEGQTYGPDEPYTAHLDAVAALVGEDETAQAIAYLHDVVEDTLVTLTEIEFLFGPFVAACVALVTDEVGHNRKERKLKTNTKLSGVCNSEYFVALLVKAADRTANVEACVRKGNTSLLQMYRKEHAAFREAVYRPDLCDHLWSRIEAAFNTKEDEA